MPGIILEAMTQNMCTAFAAEIAVDIFGGGVTGEGEV